MSEELLPSWNGSFVTAQCDAAKNDYKIVAKFHSLEQMQKAYTELVYLRAGVATPKPADSAGDVQADYDLIRIIGMQFKEWRQRWQGFKGTTDCILSPVDVQAAKAAISAYEAARPVESNERAVDKGLLTEETDHAITCLQSVISNAESAIRALKAQAGGGE